jgi:RimJ/RimL family protein N-acetyltransferase
MEEKCSMEIFLRPITKEDTDLIVKWRNSPRVSSHCLNKKPITRESHLEFFENYVVPGYYQQYIVERIEESSGLASYPIATVYLKDIDRVNRRCELCIFTSDDEEWNTESQAIAVRMLLRKAFEELYLHKVYSYVFYKFIDEAELLKKAGFTTEAILKNEAVDENGNFEDVVRFSIVNDEV